MLRCQFASFLKVSFICIIFIVISVMHGLKQYVGLFLYADIIQYYSHSWMKKNVIWIILNLLYLVAR